MQDPTPIEITGWCRCLANLGEKRNLYFIFSAPLFKKTFPRHWRRLNHTRACVKLKDTVQFSWNKMSFR